MHRDRRTWLRQRTKAGGNPGLSVFIIPWASPILRQTNGDKRMVCRIRLFSFVCPNPKVHCPLGSCSMARGGLGNWREPVAGWVSHPESFSPPFLRDAQGREWNQKTAGNFLRPCGWRTGWGEKLCVSASARASRRFRNLRFGKCPASHEAGSGCGW